MRLARAAFKSIETRYRYFLSEWILSSTYVMRSIPLKVSSSVPNPKRNCYRRNRPGLRSRVAKLGIVSFLWILGSSSYIVRSVPSQVPASVPNPSQN